MLHIEKKKLYIEKVAHFKFKKSFWMVSLQECFRQFICANMLY